MYLTLKNVRTFRGLRWAYIGVDPGFGQGGAQAKFFRDLPTARSDGERAKRAYIGGGPGPALGPWKLLYF